LAGLRLSFKPARLRKAAPLVLAGFLGWGGGFAWPDGASPFVSTALAHDGHGHGGGHGHDGQGDGGGHDRGGPGGDGGWGHGGGGGHDGHDRDGGDDGGGDRGRDGGRASHSHSSSDERGSDSSGVSYDASRNMMKLDLKIGWGERRDRLEPSHHGSEHDHHGQHGYEPGQERHRPHEHEHDHLHHHDHHDHCHHRDHHDRCHHHKKHDHDDWKEEDLTPYLNPIAANFTPRSDPTVDSIAAKDPAPANDKRPASAQQNGKAGVEATKFTIGDLNFMPNEVLAVSLDPASIARAEAMGFKADPNAIVSKASGHAITRFTVPPGLDAVRGQALLSRELAGHRFELNMVYRLYRAALNEDKPGVPDKDKAAPLPGKPSRCEADHCAARQAIGWKETLAPCAQGLKVGMIDTDVDEGHPAFAGRTIHRFDFSPDGHGAPPNSHGTAVLSLLGGNPLGATPGLVPTAEFFAANIFFSDEKGDAVADTLSLLKALDWMKSFDVKLVNMSFSGPRDELVAEAIGNLSKKGLIFVAAAGNEGPMAPPSYPAAYPQVIAVTAVTKELHNYRYANRGEHIDVAAPGVDIWTAKPGGRAGYSSGTSFAAPHVTAILAVEPRESLQQDKATLLDGLRTVDLGDQGRDPVYGRGLLMAPSKCAPPWETTASAE
jgi:hypothetical protein